jgi:hypothetical protein
MIVLLYAFVLGLFFGVGFLMAYLIERSESV